MKFSRRQFVWRAKREREFYFGDGDGQNSIRLTVETRSGSELSWVPNFYPGCVLQGCRQANTENRKRLFGQRHAKRDLRTLQLV